MNIIEILITAVMTISAVALDRYLSWRTNRIKTIKPDPHTFSKNSYCICTCCSYYREDKMNFICLKKKGKIPIEEIRKKHGCFTDEPHFKSVGKG